MADTIELLETIGSDASLRHAPLEELTGKLKQAQASDTLIAAIATGDSRVLEAELGHKHMEPPQGTLGPCHEEDEPEHEEEPPHHPAPEHEKPSSKP